MSRKKVALGVSVLFSKMFYEEIVKLFKFRELFPNKAHEKFFFELNDFAENPANVLISPKPKEKGLLALYAEHPDQVLGFLQFARSNLKQESPIREFLLKALVAGVKLDTGETLLLDDATDKDIARAMEIESGIQTNNDKVFRAKTGAVAKERQRLAHFAKWFRASKQTLNALDKLESWRKSTRKQKGH